jgi:hypothetical protein
MSTLNSMFLILPRRSVSASTGWGCRGRRIHRLSVETMAMADQAPQATLLNGMGKLQKNGSTIWYCERSRVLPSGIPGPEFWSKLILPWNDLIPMCVPPESGNSAENPEFRKMRTGINRNTGRNAHPRTRGWCH